jgi:hypothetical protein
MLPTRERLEVAVAILEQVHQRRRETGDPHLASSLERRIIERELEQLATEWIMNPAVEESAPEAPPAPPAKPLGLFARLFGSR